jgi:hypothetical protein
MSSELIFLIECVTKKGDVFYLVSEAGEFDKRLTSPKLKRWKTQRGVDKCLEKIRDRLLEEYPHIKQVKGVERSREIQAALDEQEAREFEQELESIRSMATERGVVNSGSIYRKMVLRRALGLVALRVGDLAVYFPSGMTGDFQIATVTDVGISTFTAAGITVSRCRGFSSDPLTGRGKERFLPDDTSLVDYFIAYQRIRQFVQQNWEIVEPSELIRLSEIIRVEQE